MTILLSIRKRHMDDLLSGRKSIELKKVVPACELPFEVYAYCFEDELAYAKYTVERIDVVRRLYQINGKGRKGFVLRDSNGNELMDEEKLEEATMMTAKEIQRYLDGSMGYAWRISKLERLDKPIGLDWFRLPAKGGYMKALQRFYDKHYGMNAKDMVEEFDKTLTIGKAPRSWMFVEIKGIYENG